MKTKEEIFNKYRTKIGSAEMLTKRDAIYALGEYASQFKSKSIPTDEEIRKEAHEYYKRGQLLLESPADTERAFAKGCLWMRSQLNKKEK